MNNYKLEKSLSVALSFLSVGGLVATAIFSAKDHEKARTKAKDNETVMKYGSFTEKARMVAPCYIRTASTIAGTSLCIFGASVLSKRSQASLVGAYEISKRLYDEYRQEAIAIFGENADLRIKDSIAKKKLEQDDDIEIYVPGCRIAKHRAGEKLLFHEEIADVYFEATMDDVKDAMYHLNRNFVLRGGWVPFMEFYEFLKLKNVKLDSSLKKLSWHEEWGDFTSTQIPLEREEDLYNLWYTNADGYSWIDYYISKIEMANGDEVYNIVFPFMPDIADECD